MRLLLETREAMFKEKHRLSTQLQAAATVDGPRTVTEQAQCETGKGSPEVRVLEKEVGNGESNTCLGSLQQGITAELG